MGSTQCQPEMHLQYIEDRGRDERRSEEAQAELKEGWTTQSTQEGANSRTPSGRKISPSVVKDKTWERRLGVHIALDGETAVKLVCIAHFASSDVVRQMNVHH